jgi:type IX secretion system PorP/SprF family membrane protein
MRHWIVLLLVIVASKNIAAQDPGFSQFFANPLYLNPAFAGTTELPRLAVSYRNQWPQKGATYTTYSLSYDQLLKNSNTGLL